MTQENYDTRGSHNKQFAELPLIEAATSPAPSAQTRSTNVMNALDALIVENEHYNDVTRLVVQRRPNENL